MNKKGIIIIFGVLFAIITILIFNSSKNNVTIKPPSTSTPVNPSIQAYKKDTTPLNIIISRAEKKYLDKVFEKFTNTTSIKLNFTELESYNYLDSLIIKTHENINKYDLIFFQNINEYSRIHEQGSLISLDNNLSKDFYEDFYEKTPGAEKLRINNNFYALPYKKEVYVLYYNKNLFDKFNVNYPDSNITWENYKILASQVTDLYSTPRIYGTLIDNSPFNWALPALQNEVYSNASDLSLYEYSINNILELQNKNIIPSLELLSDKKLHYSTSFINGSLSMHINSTSHMKFLVSSHSKGLFDFKWGIANIPQYKDNLSNTTIADFSLVGIQKNSKNISSATILIEFISGINGAPYLATDGFLPSYINDDIIHLYNDSFKEKPDNLDILFSQNIVLKHSLSTDSLYELTNVFHPVANEIFMGRDTTENFSNTIILMKNSK